MKSNIVLFRCGPKSQKTLGILLNDWEPQNPVGWITLDLGNGRTITVRKLDLIK